jgi:hypothetical protein
LDIQQASLEWVDQRLFQCLIIATKNDRRQVLLARKLCRFPPAIEIYFGCCCR